MSSTERSRNYGEKIKENPLKYAEYLQKEKERDKARRKKKKKLLKRNTAAAKKEKQLLRQKQNERQRKCREKKKSATKSATPSPAISVAESIGSYRRGSQSLYTMEAMERC
jgi:hypothetical protein